MSRARRVGRRRGVTRTFECVARLWVTLMWVAILNCNIQELHIPSTTHESREPDPHPEPEGRGQSGSSSSHGPSAQGATFYHGTVALSAFTHNAMTFLQLPTGPNMREVCDRIQDANHSIEADVCFGCVGMGTALLNDLSTATGMSIVHASMSLEGNRFWLRWARSWRWLWWTRRCPRRRRRRGHTANAASLRCRGWVVAVA